MGSPYLRFDYTRRPRQRKASGQGNEKGSVGNPLTYAHTLLLCKILHTHYRVLITLIKLLYVPLQYPKSNPDIHAAE